MRGLRVVSSLSSSPSWLCVAFHVAKLTWQTFRKNEVSPLEDVRLESRSLLPGDFEAIVASLKGHTRLRRLGVMELEDMDPNLIRLVGSALPHLHHLDLIFGTEARYWPGREVRGLYYTRLTSQDDYRSSFELFEDLRVFGSTRIAMHSIRYDQFPKYEALELIVVCRDDASES